MVRLLIVSFALLTGLSSPVLGDIQTELVGCPDRYPNGNRLVDGDVLRFPNGNRLKDGDVWRYPNGNRIVDGDVWRYANGNRIVDGDVWRYLNGNRFRDGDVLRYPSGNRLREPDGTFRTDSSMTIDVSQLTVSEKNSEFGLVRFTGLKQSELLSVRLIYDAETEFDLVYDPKTAHPKSLTCHVTIPGTETQFTLVSPKAIVKVEVTPGTDPKVVREKLKAALESIP